MERLEAWTTSAYLVGRIIEQHGLEEIEITSTEPVNFLNSVPVSNKLTKVDQHINHILRVADWLLAESS